MFFFIKQKTAYEMRISDWSSDVCSSDLFSFMARSPVRAILSCRRRGLHAVAHAVLGRVHRLVAARDQGQIGSASCRERVGQYVYISVVAVPRRKKDRYTRTMS